MPSYIKTLNDGSGNVVYPRTRTSAVSDSTGKDIDTLLAEKSGINHTHQKEIPIGGTAGQQLVKKSATNYDVEWKDIHAPISTTTVVVDTPTWTNQPTIEGSLDASFVDWNSNYYFVTLKDVAGADLPVGQFKLTPTSNSYSTAINQIFTLTNLDTGNSGILVEGTQVDFKTIGTGWTLRKANAAVAMTDVLLNVKRFKITIIGILVQNTGTSAAYNNNLLVNLNGTFSDNAKVSGGFNNINHDYTGSLCWIIGVINPNRVENKKAAMWLTIDGITDCGTYAVYDSRTNIDGDGIAGNTHDGRIVVRGTTVQIKSFGMSYNTMLNGSQVKVEVYE